MKELLANPVFVGLVSAGVVGTLGFAAKGILFWLKQKIVRTLTSSVTCNSCDSHALFRQLSEYVFSIPTFQKIKTVNITEEARWYGNNQDRSFSANPALGFYWGIHEKRVVFCQVSEEKNQSGGVTITLTYGCFGFDKKYLDNLVTALMNKIRNADLVKIEFGETWFTRKKRDLSSVYLEGGIKEKIIKRIDDFYNNEGKYDKLGLPYCLKFLFTGPPGTGKSSLIFALASHFGLQIKFIPNGMDEREFRRYLSFTQSRTMIVIEDVDVGSFNTTRESKENKISLSSLLNLMDGISTPSGCVFVITTNCPDNLDAALVRPGRIDEVVSLKYFSRKFAEKISCEIAGVGLSSSEDEICPAKLIGELSQVTKS